MDFDYGTCHMVAPFTFVFHAGVVYGDIFTLSSVDSIECSTLGGIKGNQGNQIAILCIFSDESMLNVQVTGIVKAGAVYHSPAAALLVVGNIWCMGSLPFG